MTSLNDFRGQNVVITGGTKGLGLATARRFAKAGANLFLLYRSDHAVASAAQAELRDLGVRCEIFACDLTQPNSAKVITQFLESKKIAVLHHFIFNAAATAFKPLLQIEHHHFLKTFHLSVWGLLNLCKELTPLMMAGSTIITISGMDTVQVVPGHGLLAAAKAAVEELTIYLAHELGPKGIRVNGVNPGFLETESTRIMMGELFAQVADGYRQGTLRAKPLDLDLVAATVLFLASPAAGLIAGQTLIVDDGFAQRLSVPTSTNPTPPN